MRDPVLKVAICPDCDRVVTDTYTLDLRADGKCTKKQHTSQPVSVEYVRATTARDAVALAMRNAHPDDGSDCDEAVAQDATGFLIQQVDVERAAIAKSREQPLDSNPSDV